MDEKFICSPEIEKYIYSLQESNEKTLKEMHDYAQGFPIAGPLVGKLLMQLTLLKKPKRMIELGSGFGYSAYWFALALEKGSKLIFTDNSEKNVLKAKEFLEEFSNLIDFRFGDALEVLKSEKEKFDLIFMDINKKQYPKAFPLIKEKLKKNGLLIVDNTLWRGSVVSESADKIVSAVREFNEMVFNDKDLISSIVPLRDGVLIALRK
ncbi:MAG TPA: O-methyltransferase [archaeon]|nr:O-methyltransferase [archaeon]